MCTTDVAVRYLRARGIDTTSMPDWRIDEQAALMAADEIKRLAVDCVTNREHARLYGLAVDAVMAVGFSTPPATGGDE